MRTESIVIVVSALYAASAASAGFISTNPLADDGFTSAVDFESYLAGDAISSLGFGDITAQITTSASVNRIIANTDGYGAVPANGTMFWKLLGGETTFDFGDAELTAFSFRYSDLEWSDIEIFFDDFDVFLLADDNPNVSNTFTYTAAPGETFSTVRFRWTGSGDGVGIDDVTIRSIPIPNPGGSVLAMIAVGVCVVRRRRG
ncbi:MAG: hypothetical protein AAFX05_08150 [Planctomycetota bacterium]